MTCYCGSEGGRDGDRCGLRTSMTCACACHAPTEGPAMSDIGNRCSCQGIAHDPGCPQGSWRKATDCCCNVAPCPHHPDSKLPPGPSPAMSKPWDEGPRSYEEGFEAGLQAGVQRLASRLQGVDGVLAQVWARAGCEYDGCLFRLGVPPGMALDDTSLILCDCLRRREMLVALARLAQVLKVWP